MNNRKTALHAVAMLFLMAGSQVCGPALAEGAVRVKTTTVRFEDHAASLVLTGEIEARHRTNVAFRVAGRVSERRVDVGDHVSNGQTLAVLEPKEQLADLEAAKASVASTTAALTQASLSLDRQKTLLAKGFTTQSNFDTAQEAYRVAQGRLRGAQAELSQAEQDLGDTILRAQEDGVITERFAEVGQVVQPGGTVFSIARDGARDAVFKVQEALFANRLAAPDFSLTLVSDPSVTAKARIREVSPTIDARTGTVRIKAAIAAPSPLMTLGAPVTGKARIVAEHAAVLPWSALISRDGNPAVWVVDPASYKVRLRRVTVSRHETGRVFVSGGVRDGEIVVSEGGQYLFADARVDVAGGGDE
jgi:RND family efflux transporter MFP subunit